jgi:hypothetical protein
LGSTGDCGETSIANVDERQGDTIRHSQWRRLAN